MDEAVKFHAETSKQACGLGGCGFWARPPVPARAHHSRRREFCCLEPGAGGGKGEGVVASHSGVPRRVSKLFWRDGWSRVLTGDGDTGGN